MVLDSHLTFRDNRVQDDHFSKKNLEMSGSLTAVRELITCHGKVEESQGKLSMAFRRIFLLSHF